MINEWLTKWAGTTWSGRGELWLDPEGNNAETYDCELTIDSQAIDYAWYHENERQTGRFTFHEHGAIWVDSWHQPEAVQTVHVPAAWGIFTVSSTYAVPGSPDWGWRSNLAERPDGSLVLQMTNITPWGEEGRAVRMVLTRENA